MKNKVIYYSDPLNDDFAGTSIVAESVGTDYCYIHSSPLWRLETFLLYYGVAYPLVWVASKFWLGLRFRNKKVLRGCNGFFLYGNHTQFLDAFVPPMAAGYRKAYTVANPDAISIKGLKWVVQMLGVLPLPTQRAAMHSFMDAMEQRIREGSAVAIYPEAHIWPYYNGIRPFKATSFRYPVRLHAPVFSMTAVYRKRWWSRRPAMTIHLDGPFYPDPNLSEKEAAQKLRDQVYQRMCRTVEEEGSVEYIRYIQKEP